MQTPTQNLTLYHYESCPYCRRVRHFMAKNDLDFPLKDTRLEPEARRELIELGGKPQVPALSIDGDILYESGDIIRWLQENIIKETAYG